jgi:lysophospholipase L1-like esterase
MMRAVRSLAVVLLLALSNRVVAEPTRVACIGDSITAGWGLKDPARDSYPAQLQVLLGEAFKVGNFGHSGATLIRESHRPYWSQKEFAAATEFAPDIVVIHLGTNDAQPRVWPDGKHAFVPTMKELIKYFQDLASKPKVYVCMPVPAFEGRMENVRRGVVPLVRQAAREASVRLIDLNSPLAGRQDLFPDRLHPSQRGAALMAVLVHAEIGDFRAAKRAWKLISVDSEETSEGPGAAAIDGDADTYWHTGYSKSLAKHPHQIEIDLGESESVVGMRYVPRTHGVNGRVKEFELYFSEDGRTWGEPATRGTLAGHADAEVTLFDRTIAARFLRFRVLSEVNGGPWTSVAELDVLRLPGAPVRATSGAAGGRR